ncbi:MAG: hypothetical protein P4M07_10785 [Xanthobacteraceae bacterium]|nr:hypothetical protein [Xanthobacteraceae bacterium]
MPDSERVRQAEQAADRLFCRTIADLHDGALAQPAQRSVVRAGVYAIELAFASRALAEAYAASFLPEEDAAPAMRLAVVTASDVDLSHLIPAHADEGRTHVTDACFVSWYADRRRILYALDRATRRGLVWLADDAAPEWELSRPACPLINVLTVGTRHVIAHGGAVSRDGRCLLLAGKGRAGKTTAALACARAGWDYAGDDYFFADTESGRVEPLYVSARLRADMSGAFAELLATSRILSDDDGDSRHELRLSRWLTRERIAGGRVEAVLLPRRRGAARPQFEPATRTQAFEALFRTTALGLPGPMQWTAAKLTRLVALAPAFFVDTGSAPDAIPEAFGAFLDSLPGAV